MCAAILKQNEINECDKLINKYILRARKFIEYGCFQYGKYSYAIGKKPTTDFISDFQYFVLTKSTKSLEAIRQLLDMGHTEDVFILARTMFEGYLASRYICEEYNDDLLNDIENDDDKKIEEKALIKVYQSGAISKGLKGEELAEMFRTRWIPMEENYFLTFNIPDKSDLIYNTN